MINLSSLIQEIASFAHLLSLSGRFNVFFFLIKVTSSKVFFLKSPGSEVFFFFFMKVIGSKFYFYFYLKKFLRKY